MFLRDITERNRYREELERQVADRTAQLTNVNQELRNEIVQRKNASEQLLLNFQILRDTVTFNKLILSASSIGFLVYESVNGKCVTANQAAAEIVGTTVKELQSQNFRQIPSWVDSGLLEKAEEALKTKTEQTVEANFTTTFGKTIYLHGTFNTFDQGGKRHLLFSFVDITEVEQSRSELAHAYDATLEGWARALELRDPMTEGHTRRVANFTVELARAMNINEDSIIHIRRGALLHDIGKIAISDAILNKPDALTEQEMMEIKRHPEYAVEMLKPIAYLQPALEIVANHHEKWDGTGYPTGLSGEQIPISARIFSVVDVWDALRMDRPYRPKWSRQKTIGYIKENTGKHFDPRVVATFLNNLPSENDRLS